MNQVAKIFVAATLALGALSAQAEDLSYPKQAAKSSMDASSAGRPTAAGQETPYLFKGEVLVDNPKYQAAPGRSAVEVRQEIIKARLAPTAATVGA